MAVELDECCGMELCLFLFNAANACLFLFAHVFFFSIFAWLLPGFLAYVCFHDMALITWFLLYSC